MRRYRSPVTPPRRSFHTFGDGHHTKWDNSIPAALQVESGDIVAVNAPEPTGGQIAPDSGVDAARKLDWDRIHTLAGPIAVIGAEPGDVLEVELLDIQHEGWAWTGVFPGFGLLSEDFGEEFALKIWQVGDDQRAELVPGISVAIEPFLGVMGVAPREDGPLITMPPRPIGGNLDIRHLCVGSKLYLPVEVPTALFSLGDGHLAQGDGEVCGTALEGPLSTLLRFRVHKDKAIRSPQYETSGPTTTKSDGMGYFATTSTGTDLHRCAQEALQDMVELLQDDYGLSSTDAYILCSAAGDLKFSVPQLGDTHAACVTFNMPYSVFRQ